MHHWNKGCSEACAMEQNVFLFQDEKQKIRQEKRRRHKSAILYRSTSEIHGESSSVGVFGSGGSKKGDDVLARCTRDDLSLLSDQTHDDVAVQTGSSLTSGADSDTLESMLLGEF